jgi:hypothetical protein
MNQRRKCLTSRHDAAAVTSSLGLGCQLPDVVGSLGSFVGTSLWYAGDPSRAGGSRFQADRWNTRYESRTRWDEQEMND